MSGIEVVSAQEWLADRKALLEEEKALTRQKDALAARVRALPVVRVSRDYRFDGEQGDLSLEDLFDGRSQLVVYHFMFGPDWTEGCPSCSLWADSFNGSAAHLRARDTAFACVSNGPLAKLLAYRKRMGWSFNWVSSMGSTFNSDFGVTFGAGEDPRTGYNYTGNIPDGEMPGLSTFVRLDDGSIGHGYSTFARGLEPFNAIYGMLDLTHHGRNEAELPWPMAWVRRHDRYEAEA